MSRCLIPTRRTVAIHHHVHRYRWDDVLWVCVWPENMIVLRIGRGVSAALSGLFFSPAPRSRATSRVLIPIPSPLSSLGPFQKINSSLGGQEIDARRLSRLAPRLHIDPSRICQSLCAYPQTCLDFFPFHPRPSVVVLRIFFASEP